MSMISGQVDRLRTAAQTYRRLGNHSAESMLLDAADTIWELRDDLQRANADNAKLRELLLAVWNDAMQFDGFWDYVHDDGEIYNEDELPHYQERMRELGIEVDG